jgi:gamma-glutamylcyclotransferase (GGCT)/AIG2-like uncharacterized protein YtfP
MREAEPACLFVYGTLLTRARGELGADMRARLSKESTSLGEATISGRLFDLGDYPGLVSAPGTRDSVHGELFRLNRPEDALAWLDAYEGASDKPGPNDEYARVRASVRRTSGEEVMAWVYVYRGDHARGRVIPGGRWDG